MDAQTNQSIYVYDAFISYRHTYPDILIAERLHRLLETYKTPHHLVKQGIRRGLPRVFRDKEELPTSSDLNSDIDRALQQSRFLIVICSPRTPESKWVKGEIDRFKELHGNDKILAILIEGEPSQSFPPEIFGVSRTIGEKNGSQYEINKVTEPLAADVRAENNRESLKKLKNEKLRILAPILGCRYDDLRQRHRERKIKRWILLSSVLAAFFFLFGIFTLIQLNLVRESEARAVKSERIAIDNEQKALANERIAKENEQKALSSESTALSAMSRYQLDDGNRLEAMRLALDALPYDMDDPQRPYVYEAEIALYNAFYSNPYQGRIILKGHKEQVQHLEFSKDGSMLATASEDYTVLIWRTVNGTKLAELTGHSGPVIHCSFNSDGTKLATSSTDGTVRIWDTETGKELIAIGDFKSLQNSVFSPDDNSVITLSNIGYQWWDTLEGKELLLFESNRDEYVDSFNTDSGLAVVGIADGQSESTTKKYSYYVMNIVKGTALYKIDLEGNRLICSSISADAAKVATVINDSMDVWDAFSGDHLIALDGVDTIPVNISFSPDGKYIFGESAEDIVYIWECNSGKRIGKIPQSRLTTFNWTLIDVAGDLQRFHMMPDLFVSNKPASFSSNGNKLVIYSSSGEIQIFSNEIFTGSYWKERTVDGHKAGPQYAVFSPDDSFLAVSYDDNSVCIFDTHPGVECTFSEDICGYTTDIFNPDGTRILSNKEAGKLSVWNASSGGPEHEFQTEDGYTSVAVFSPDGRKIAGSYNDDKVMLWDADTYMEIAAFTGHGSKVTCLFFNHDSSLLAVGSENGSVRVWDTVARELLWIFENDSGAIFDMAFSPDGSQLATSSGVSSGYSPGSADIWSLITGERLKNLVYNSDGSGLTMDDNTFELFTFKPQNVEYSPDGTRLICFSTTDATIHIIDTTAFSEHLSLKNVSSFKGAAFSPDGLNIATLGLNNSIEIWDAGTGGQLMDFGNSGTTGYVLRYSHDGRWLMAVYFDGIHIYDVKTGQELFFLEQSEWYSDGMFSSDDQRILISTYGKKAYVWDLITSTNELIRNAREYLEFCGY
ncbi:MAG: TIR domain-containing protein [Clostridia bacterium]|nr:TIR domain-containing protein [Clostridia bacterium]